MPYEIPCRREMIEKIEDRRRRCREMADQPQAVTTWREFLRSILGTEMGDLYADRKAHYMENTNGF